MIDADYLSKKFAIIGINKGDVLFIHSAFSAVGPVEGGVETFLDALCMAVGEEGTVIFPTFTNRGTPFSVKDSVANTGVLSETFRHRKSAVRSLHPTHSAAAIGRQAEYFTGSEWVTDTTCGEGTIYMKLANSDAKQMMLGVDLNRCTMLHCSEDAAVVDYLLPEVKIAPPVERPDITAVRKYPPGHRAFIHLMKALRDKPWFTQMYIGEAKTIVYPIKEMHDYCMEELKADPYLFLCENPSCNSCMYIRKNEFLGGKTCAASRCEVCRFDEY